MDIKNFGEYNLFDQISKGGMAEIFLAASRKDKKFKLYAIKKILTIYNNDKNFISMFRKEARIGELLKHPNIVQIYSSGVIDNENYLALEFIEGLTLRQIESTYDKISKRPPIGFSLWIMAEVLRGLHYAHNLHDSNNNYLGLVHRDISPQNIMISYSGVSKILDFGIVKETEATIQTEMGVVKGKKGFMSPEQARGHKLDHRSDLFSVGLILVRLLSGLSLVDYRTEIIHLFREDFSNHCKNQKIPFEIEDTILSCLEENLNLRIASAELLSKKIDSLLSSYFPSINQNFISKYLKATFSTHYEKVTNIVQICENQFNSHEVDETFSSTIVQDEESRAFQKDQSHIIAGLIPEDNFHLENTVEKPAMFEETQRSKKQSAAKKEVEIPENLVQEIILNTEKSLTDKKSVELPLKPLTPLKPGPPLLPQKNNMIPQIQPSSGNDNSQVLKIIFFSLLAAILTYLVFFRS